MNLENVVYIILVVLLVEPWMVYSAPKTTTVTETRSQLTRTLNTQTFTKGTTTTKKPKRKKTKVLRSIPKTTTPKPTKPKTTTPDSGPNNWVLFLDLFKKFYCMKKTECVNDFLYFEREPQKLCGRCYVTRELVWFDHKCSMWEMNCLGRGMFFKKDRAMCNGGASRLLKREEPRPTSQEALDRWLDQGSDTEGGHPGHGTHCQEVPQSVAPATGSLSPAPLPAEP